MRMSCIVTGWIDNYLHYESRRHSLSSVQFQQRDRHPHTAAKGLLWENKTAKVK